MKAFLPIHGAATGVFLLLHAALPATAQAQAPANRYVHGSWVNVRATAAADGPVVDHLITNTPVVLRAENGKSCEIAWTQDGREGKGFVACKLLGDKPLTLADANSPLRAFWIAPSMEALFAAGDHFTATLLTQAQRDLEGGNGPGDAQLDKPPRLVRYPVPEFEAMKALLAKGIIAPDQGEPWTRSCDDILAENAAQPKKADTRDDELWRYDEPACALPKMALRLPKAAPSLFKRGDRLLPGASGIEEISAGLRIAERGKTIAGPQWQNSYDRFQYTGAWDIGKYEMTLDKPIVEHVIGRTGLVGAYTWTPQVRITPNQHVGCAEGLLDERRGKQPMPGYPAVKDALMWFQAPQALPFRTAKIRARTERAPASGKESLAIKRVAVYDIDLDGDGVSDFVQWDVFGVPMIQGGDPDVVKREVYVNVGGRWYPFGQSIYHECT